MAIQVKTRRVMAHALKSYSIASEIGDVIDAGSGTLSAKAREKIQRAMGNRKSGRAVADKIDAGTVLTGRQACLLGVALVSRSAASDINTELAT